MGTRQQVTLSSCICHVVVNDRRTDWETEQRVKAKLAARRAASERGFAAETREAVAAGVAEHDGSGLPAERDGRSLIPKNTRAATAEEMLGPQMPVVCRWCCAALHPCIRLVCKQSLDCYTTSGTGICTPTLNTLTVGTP